MTAGWDLPHETVTEHLLDPKSEVSVSLLLDERLFLSCGFVGSVKRLEEKPKSNKEEPQERQGRESTRKKKKMKKNEKEEERKKERKKERREKGRKERKEGKKGRKERQANLHLLTQQPANGFTSHGANDMAKLMPNHNLQSLDGKETHPG